MRIAKSDPHVTPPTIFTTHARDSGRLALRWCATAWLVSAAAAWGLVWTALGFMW